MKSLAKSLTAWLNFLFQNPRSCGCNGSVGDDVRGGERRTGKRESENGVGFECGGWRLPKRQRDCELKNGGDFSGEIPRSKFGYLRDSLQDVCSFDDLKERMRGYLSLDGCKEVFTVMTQVAKNIDEGRLKMRAHCPIVTDVGMREKAIKVLMCYNPIWLRIGLYVIFGGESLLPNEDSSSEQEIAFLKMMIEKQFFTHVGLAKAYAYNKLVDGLYRPGYFEALGDILLKRFLLLVLILDRGKCQSSLPLKYGIDGLDGGSPLLFNPQFKIKSSQQMINDFLSSDVMHGEGNLLAHLVIVGYKVSYQQIPLIEYDFRIIDLFQDLQDGVRLCRAIQLLLHDSSILTKVVLPSDTPKKKLANCGIALQYLKQAGVPLQDDDDMVIVGEDIASGDKELTLSLLWNMFVHLQLPLLITKTSFSKEISKIRKADTELMDIDASTHLNMLLNWMKAICENYAIEMESLTSLVDGKAMWCLLDFYFRKELHCSCSMKDFNEASEASIVSMRETTDAVHNFVLSQKITTLLGNFPEVLQICDILEYNGACNDRSVVILLVFLSSQLLVRKSKDQLNFHKLMGCHCQTPERKRSSLISEAASDKETEQSAEEAAKKFRAVKAWWQEMAKRNANCIIKPEALTILSFSTDKCSSDICLENAAVVIQSHFRRAIERKKYLKIKKAVSCLQSYMHAWLIAKQILKHNKISTTVIQGLSSENCEHLDGISREIIFMVDRHSFMKLKSATSLIQKAARDWISQRQLKRGSFAADEICNEVVNGSTQKKCLVENGSVVCFDKDEDELRVAAAVKIQLSWKQFLACSYRQNQYSAAIVIQSHFRGSVLQKRFLNQKRAAVKIQNILQSLRSSKDFHEYRVARKSAIVIQSHFRGWIVRRDVCQQRNYIVLMQSYCHRWLARRDFMRQKEAALRIQSAFRLMMCWKAFNSKRHAAIQIQCFARGRITRTRLLGSSCLCASGSRHTVHSLGSRLHSTELRIVLLAIVKLQRWWKRILMFKLRSHAAIVIQSYIRGCICRQKATKERQHAAAIQAHWKGYLARKDAKEQLHDLRLRIRKSAAAVDDGMRIINRLIAALKELKSMKNVSGILHNCATLDLATAHSHRCCERLVDEGAIDILLYQIRSVTRSIPDQEVLKHCLSTLRNLARYLEFADVLVDHQRSVETILWELLRNKEEGFFIACELLKKLCSRPRGIEAIRSLPSMLKRLHVLVEDLTRKANHEKRNQRGLTARDTTERRSREAMELLILITHG